MFPPVEPAFVDQKIRVDLVLDTLRQAGGTGHGDLLEVGCGGGGLAYALSQAGYNVYACDVPNMSFPRSPRVFFADGRRLPVPSNRFDYAISSEVLEHVPVEGREAFLGELARILKPGGRLVLTAFVRRTIAFRLWGAGWLLCSPSGGLPTWYAEHAMYPPPTTRGIQEELTKLGLRVERTFEFQGAIGLAVIWIQNATGWMGLTKYTHWIRPFYHWGGKGSCVVVAQKPR